MLLHPKENIKYFFFLLLIGLGLSHSGSAQGIVINEADSSWMTQEIPSKTLSKKKFTLNRRWYQNLVTHYNYYFNANQTLQRTIAQAKHIHQDNYDSILSVYPYTPSDFTSLKAGIDSVILNAGIGIELHDPRGKWIEDLYLLIGEANFYKQDYQEAVKSFKYMIKNLGEHDEMGKPKLVGTRAYHSEKDIPVLTSEEKKKNHPPARNDAFIWLTRSYLNLEDYDKATALLNEVKTDPALPDRLQASLYATESIYFLEKERYDSALQSLSTAITFQRNKKLQARWQYLLSQLYEHQKRWDEAVINYKKVNNYSPSSVMKFYAYLNQIRIRILQNPERFKVNSKLMIDMVKKEKYSHYRSIIYYQLGLLALQTGHSQEGAQFLRNSLRYNPKEKDTHGSTYLKLANHFYEQKEYRSAKKYYDTASSIIPDPGAEIKQRQTSLTKVVENLNIITHEDSLLTLARMPKDSLMTLLKTIVADSIRAYKRKNRILDGTSNHETNPFGQKNEKKSLTNNKEGNTWYFYNNVTKSRGFSAFKAKWGNRPLADDWRLSNPSQPVNITPSQSKPILTSSNDRTNIEEREENLLQELLQPLPLTSEAVGKAEQKKMNARHEIINVFFLQLDNNSATLSAIQKMLKDHPDNLYLPDIYYKLYLIYSHIPNKPKADHYKQILLSHYTDTKYAGLFKNPDKDSTKKGLENTIQELYNTAYTDYLSGNYQKIYTLQDSALYLDPQNKQKARFDLLHAMSIIKTETDSAGKIALQKVIQKNPTDTPIVRQAQLILEKLQHKQKVIENILHLQSATDTTYQSDSIHSHTPKSVSQSQDRAVQKEIQSKKPLDSSSRKKGKSPITPYKIDSNISYFVIFSLKDPDNNLLKHSLDHFTEYNRKFHSNDSIEVSSYTLTRNRNILLFRLFKNEKDALLYYGEIKEKIPVHIIPDIKPNQYQVFFISRNNFILLNNTQDYEDYLSFFYKHYK